MEKNTRKQSILVISKNAELANITRQSAEEAVEVDYAFDETQGLNKIREKRPDIVILGNLEPAGAVLKFYRQLREGWISRHASLLVVELNTSEDSHRILSEENLEVGIGEYTFLSGATSPLFPSEYLLPRLKEIIRNKLQKRKNVLRS